MGQDHWAGRPLQAEQPKKHRQLLSAAPGRPFNDMQPELSSSGGSLCLRAHSPGAIRVGAGHAGPALQAKAVVAAAAGARPAVALSALWRLVLALQRGGNVGAGGRDGSD